MTINEKQSLRKKKSLLFLVEKGEYSAGYALLKTEELYDNGKLTDIDYEELAEYFEDLLNRAEEVQEEVEQVVEEPVEDNMSSTEEESKKENPWE